MDQQPVSKKGFSGKQVLGLLFLAILITAGLTFWLIRTYIYASDFKPVMLSSKEQIRLDHKFRQLGIDPEDIMPRARRNTDNFDADGRLVPEAYSEQSGQRSIRINERELNAMVANNADLARRVAIDLDDGLASAKILIPVDPDMPLLGGKTLRVKAGLELDYRDKQPIVILRGVSIMGIPIPNAWLGNLKNTDLVKEFGGSPGFWQSFSAGIEQITITDGELQIELAK